MANQLEILISARDNASGTMKNVASSAKAMGNAVEDASKKMDAAGARASKFEQAASRIDSAGRNGRIGLSALGQAADLVGVNLNGIIGPAAGAADAIGDIVGTLGEFGKGAGVVAVAGISIGLVVQKLQAQHDATVKTIVVSDNYLRSMSQYTATNTAVAASIQKIADQMTSLQGMASANPLTRIFESFQTGKIQIEDFFASLDNGIVRFRSLPEIIGASKQALDDMTWSARSGYDALESLRSSSDYAASAAYAHAKAEESRALALDYAAAAARRVAEAIGDTRGEAIEDYRSGARSVSEMNTAAWKAKYEFKEGAGWVEKISKNAKEAASKVSQMTSKLRGLVESALTPTEADPNLGNTWDEARKRFEAFATGTDTGAYGEDFKKMFDELGMSADQAAKAFKNFSLFADPKNIKLADMGPIVAQVEEQLLGMAGKANLVKEAMAQVWANLSPTAKAALAEQGINDASDAIEQMVDPAGAAQKQVDELGTAINAIPRIVTTTFNAVTDSAKKAIQDLADFLDKFINAYGTITVSANGEFSGPTSGGTGAPPQPNYNPLAFAEGGSFIIPAAYGREGFRMGGIATASGGERVTVTPRGATNNFGSITVVLPNVTNGGQFVNELNRALGKRATMRAAMGI